ncbi:MAG: hypothetical protein GOVbin3107_6 [Prokaryotic dsDNA virus sp.]|nr:MAG: hypothetical protein GOVbin3107_6 [Prokaryotic dsDNA virus sp.]|tara:strand:+ start:1945 stop:2820 length:876 start_codon:yes stop_codon:yes gene_type:complete
MAKISDTSSYPSITPGAGDYLVLTDVSDSNSTKTVTMQSIADFIGGGGASIQAGDGIDIDFGTVPSTISADLKSNGGIVFESTELAVDLGASSITGTLAVGDGGTGATTLTSGGILKGNGTSSISADGDINDLVSAQYSTGTNGSMYFGTIPSGLSGTPLSNTSIGNKAGNLLTTGAANTLLGEGAGNSITSGDSNVVIGARADVSAAGVLDATIVGHLALGARDGVALGKEANAGRDGIAIGSGAEALANTISIGSSGHGITLDATSRTTDTFLPIMINGTQYYIQLYVP